MDQLEIDIVGEPAVIAKIVELAASCGLTSSKPMPTDSISDALDAPFGVDEIRPVREIVTVITGTRNSLTGFLASIRNLLSVSETDSGADPAVDLIQTKGQRKIGVVMKDTDLSTLKM